MKPTAVLLYDDCRHNWLQRFVLHAILRRRHFARWLDADEAGNLHVSWNAEGVAQVDE